MNIDTVWLGPDALGEGPMWHAQEQALYWIDIVKPSVQRLDPVSGDYQEWRMPDLIGSVVPHAKGGMVVTVGDSVLHLDTASGKLTPIAKIPHWSDDVFMNDGKCDRQGRFWIGVASFDAENPKGGLYRLDPDGTVTQMEKGITISNGLGWSPDEKTFYYTDGLRYRVYQYDFDNVGGALSNRRTFLQFDKTPVAPDGLTVDSEGCVWEAHWNNWKICRYAPDGSLLLEIDMPVQRPTSCIFGGPHLDTLYVTSCSRDRDETEALSPPAGAVFAIDVGVKGLPEPAFG